MPNLAKTTPKGPYADEGQAITWTAADNTDQTFAFKEGDVLLAWNTGAGSHAVTIYSSTAGVPSRRVDDITAETITTGQIRVYRLTRKGWRQSNGTLKVKGNHAEVKFAMLTGL